MKNTFILVFVILIFATCKKDDGPREKRYLDKVEIIAAKLAAFDILNGPDMMLFYRDGQVDSISNLGGSETFTDVGPLDLPITFEEVEFELTNYMDFRVLDFDEFDPDDVMFQLEINPYQMSENGNPFRIWNAEWEIFIYWKTQ